MRPLSSCARLSLAVLLGGCLLVAQSCTGTARPYSKVQPVSINRLDKRPTIINVQPWVDKRNARFSVMNKMLILIPLYPYTVGSVEGDPSAAPDDWAKSLRTAGEPGPAALYPTNSTYSVLPLLCRYLREANLAEQITFNSKKYGDEEVAFVLSSDALDPQPAADFTVVPTLYSFRIWNSLTMYGLSFLTIYQLSGGQSGGELKMQLELVDQATGQILLSESYDLAARTKFHPVFAFNSEARNYSKIGPEKLAPQVHSALRDFVEKVDSKLPPSNDIAHWNQASLDRERRIAIAERQDTSPKLVAFSPPANFDTDSDQVEVRATLQGKFSAIKEYRLIADGETILKQAPTVGGGESFEVARLIPMNKFRQSVVLEAEGVDGKVLRHEWTLTNFTKLVGQRSEAQAPAPVIVEPPVPPSAVHALVIGVGKFQHGIAPLKFPAADAQALKGALIGAGVPDSQITVLTDEAATKRNVEQALQVTLARQAAQQDSVIVFYSGHGATEPTITGSADGLDKYLVLHDTDPTALRSTALGFDGLSRDLRMLPSRRALVLVDACYAGGGKSIGGEQTKALNLKDEYTKEFTVEVAKDATVEKGHEFDPESWTRSVSFIASSRANQVSLEDDGAGLGVFTSQLVQALGKPSVDRDGDGWLAPEEIFGDLMPAVQRASGNRQTPLLHPLDGPYKAQLIPVRR